MTAELIADQVADNVIAALWREPSVTMPDVYAILDCARDPKIHPWIHRNALDYTCLYRGPIAPELDKAAPYLVHLYPHERFTRDLFAMGWGKSWGILVKSLAPMEALRLHFRKFLRVHDERGKRMIFRYYDPRVLRVYLPTCQPDELKFIFGPTATLGAESDDARALLEYQVDGGKLVTEPIDVAVSVAGPLAGPADE